MGIRYSIDGLKDLEKELGKLEKLSRQKAVFRKAIDVAAEPMAQVARANAPVAPVDGGTLRDSIGIKGRLTKSQARQHRSVKDPHSVERFLGSSDRKAHLVEFGTYKMAPQPFLRPAMDAHVDTYFKRIGAEISAQIARQIRLQDRANARAAAKVQ